MDSISAGALDPVPRTFDDDELDAETVPQFKVQSPVATWASGGATKVGTLVFAATPEASCFLGCSVPADSVKSGTIAVEVGPAPITK